MTTTYDAYVSHMRKVADLEHTMAVMHWDKEVGLPKKGAPLRSQQLATLAGITHELATSEKLGDLLQNLSENNSELSHKEQRNVSITLDDFKKAKKFTKEFVERRSLVTSESYHAWLQAREANDYQVFEPALNKMIGLKREEAQILGFKGHPYDALVDNFEKGATVKDLDVLFEKVKNRLVDFVKEIRKKAQVDNTFLFERYDKDKQWTYGLDLLKLMGYDFEAGRQDLSPHPFTTSFGPTDVRVTTRIDENNFGNMAWSCIHEGGHALYEQGLSSEEYGLPSGKYLSLGIHESQSRLWENNVGRSLPFWKGQYADLQQRFPENLKSISVDQFYKGINKINPSFIRTESDELHYHLHILIRYQLEKSLIEDGLQTADLSDAWNQQYKNYLGLEVSSDNMGVLQDIHWSHGSLGYFPTYSLGSFYAAQFYDQAEKDIDGLDHKIESGDMTVLLDWLREKIHIHGQTFTASDLCKKITGEVLNFDYFMDYVTKKYGAIYQ